MPNFKKIISILCAASMIAATMAIPVLADDDAVSTETVVETEETAIVEAAVEAASVEETADENEETVDESAETEDTDISLMAYEGYEFYDEDFEDFSGNILNLKDNFSNTTYKNSKGITFTCPERSSGTSGYSVDVDTGYDGKCIHFVITNLNQSDSGVPDQRIPYFELNKMTADDAAIGDELYVSFDAKFNTTASSLSLTDGNKTISVSTSLSDNMTTSTWYNFTLISYPDDKAYTIIIKDTSGNFIDKIDGAGALTTLTKVSVLGGNEINLYFDNLYVADAVVPVFTLEDLERIDFGTSTTIANITNADSVTVELDDTENFSYEYDESTGDLALTPGENAAGKSVTAAITASANKDIVITKTYSANTNAGFAAESAADINLYTYNEGVGITTATSGYYATANFSVPVEDRGAEITWSSSDTSLVSVTKTGKATIKYPDPGDTDTLTLTATVNYNGSKTTVDIPIQVMNSLDYLESIKSSLDILTDNSSVLTSSYAASGNLTLPTTLENADVSWSSSNTDMLEISGETAYVYPSADGTVTLTATLTYGTSSTTREYTINISAYYNEYKTAFDQAVEEATYFYYTADTSCSDIKTTAEDNALIFSDLYLTTSVTTTVGEGDDAKNYDMVYDWEISDSDYINSDGTLNISDMALHENAATISLTVKYVKNNVDVFVSDTKSYTVDVQFSPSVIEPILEEQVEAAYLIDDSTVSREESSTAARAAALAKYMEAFIYDYQVKYDYAYSDNWDGIPTSATSSSDYVLPLEGYFGSTFTWSSSSTCLKITATTGEISVTTPSSTTSVTLTAVISAGTAEPKSYTSKVSVKGKSSSSGSGGGGGGGSSSSSSSSSGSSGTGVVAVGDLSGASVDPSEVSSASTINPNPSGFTDLDDVSWALTAINNLYVNGVINGKTSTLFYPNDSVTRAEFAKMLILAFNFETVSADTATFTDVSLSNWASEYVEAAYEHGIISGFDDGSFEPDSEITRQDMAVMVYRAATSAGYTIEEKVDEVTFTDESIIAAYSKEAVSALQKANIISGLGDGNFGPLDTSTRAQACQIIYNVFNK